jgi:lysozyme
VATFVLKLGSTGARVHQLQHRLNCLQDRNVLTMDGRFNLVTEREVIRWQHKNKIKPSGRVGIRGMLKLLRQVRALPKVNHGLDVSNNNGFVNWEAVAKNNPQIKFFYAKVTEGNNFVDAYWPQNYAGGILSGFEVGGYLFGHAGTPTDGVTQALFFLNHLKYDSHHMLRPVVDWEGPNTIAPSQVPTLEAIVRTIHEKTGVYPLIYGSGNLAEMHIPSTSIIAKCDLWLAAYSAAPNKAVAPAPWKSYVIHQYSEKGAVQGTAAGKSFDLDITRVPVHHLR